MTRAIPLMIPELKCLNLTVGVSKFVYEAISRTQIAVVAPAPSDIVTASLKDFHFFCRVNKN
jgi:hypothetical protein